ncbi:MAG: threonylcarbamoyl-AMP synthase [Synergistaceae bacterium]|nr:threonylcarbamoyl-AMP synthase [Synergistaceae bacterium]
MTTITVTPDSIALAAQVIKSGGLVAFPTETVYGLGADALNPEAVKKIFIAKQRPQDKALILHVNTIQQASSLVEMNDEALKLAERFWPGPLTLVLPAKEIVPSVTRAGLSTAAVRMPDNPAALALIEAAGTPIAAPSANLSGRPSPKDAQAVLRDLDGRIDMIIDGGKTKIGTPSTIIDMTDPSRPVILRAGSISEQAAIMYNSESHL